MYVIFLSTVVSVVIFTNDFSVGSDRSLSNFLDNTDIKGVTNLEEDSRALQGNLYKSYLNGSTDGI